MRREVIEGVRQDGVDLVENWRDQDEHVVHHGEATTSLADFLDRCEAANIARVGAFLSTRDCADVVWGIM